MDELTIKEQMESMGNIQTFMIHLYRSETGRELAMRSRLDVTIGGAVVVTSGLIPFAFSGPDASHIFLLGNGLLVLVFLLVEARRFQIYEMVKQRVRKIEQHYIAPLINQISLEPKVMEHPPHVHHDLVDTLLHYQAPISHFEAVVWRMRNVYIFLFGVIYVVWLQKILGERTDQPFWDYVNQQAAVGSISGTAVFFVVTALMLVAVGLSLYVPHIKHEFDSI